jgi:hypothetical protein
LNTQVLSHSARWTRLLWPLKSNHYLRQCVHLKEQPVRRQHIPYTNLHLSSEIPEQVIFKLLSGKSPNRMYKHTWSDLDTGILMHWRRMEIPTPYILASGLFTSGSSRAVIGHLFSRGKGSRFSYVKSKGEETPVRLAGDCNPWVSKMLSGGPQPSWNTSTPSSHPSTYTALKCDFLHNGTYGVNPSPSIPNTHMLKWMTLYLN